MKILKPILFFVITTLLTLALPFSGILMPLFSVFAVALSVALSVKWHVLYSVFSAAFSGLAIYFLSGMGSAITFPVITLFSVVGIYISLKNKAQFKTVLLCGTIGPFVLIGVLYFIYGGNFVSDVLNIAKSFLIESVDSVMATFPSDSAELAAEMKQFYNAYFENLKVIAPAIILSFIFLLSYFSIKLSGRFAKNEPEFDIVPSFSEMRAPSFFIIIAIITYFVQTIQNPFFSGLMANVFMVLTVYLTMCGFALLDFLLKIRFKNVFARVGILLGVSFLLTIVSSVLYFANPILIAMLLGAADSLFNYRTKIRMLKGK